MRSSADLDPRRRQILYRAWHRGTREMDLVLGRFADAELHLLDEAELDELEHLMTAPDPEIYKWLSGAHEVPDNWKLAIVARIRAFHLRRDQQD